jgi:hypothetical protein
MKQLTRDTLVKPLFNFDIYVIEKSKLWDNFNLMSSLNGALVTTNVVAFACTTLCFLFVFTSTVPRSMSPQLLASFSSNALYTITLGSAFIGSVLIGSAFIGSAGSVLIGSAFIGSAGSVLIGSASIGSASIGS